MTRSFELRDLREALSAGTENIDNYQIENEHDPANSDLASLLEDAVERVAESSENITDTHTFDTFQSILKFSDSVPSVLMSKVLDSISSGLAAEIEATVRDKDAQTAYSSHKTPLELYAFLLQFFVLAVEKVKAEEEDAGATRPRRGRGGKTAGRATGRSAAARKKNEEWTWVKQVPATMALICKLLESISSQRIWTTTAERETFIACITRPAYHVAENEQYMKFQEIRKGVYLVICLAVKQHNHAFAAQTSIMQHLQFFEHLSEPMAECLSLLSKEYDHSQLGDEILREIANMNFSGADTKSTRSFARFLVHFSEISPRSMLKQISLLITQLDSEAYPIRNAIVEAIGALILDLANTEEGDADGAQSSGKQIIGLYRLLLDRMLDLSSYVRTKVLAVFARLCSMKDKYPKQRLLVTRAAVAALEDKVASVRKGAIIVLMQLITTHPWEKVDGGLLKRSVFEERYAEFDKQVKEIEANVGIDAKQTETQARKEGTGEDDDTMDVDGQRGEDTEEEGQGDPDENDMVVDGSSPGRRRKSKVKPRPSMSLADIPVRQALEQFDAQKLLHLQLQRKYCNEGIHFIQYIESAGEIICRLLGSTSKAEVLESIEFFRVAHSYEMENAQEGIKKMLHLIWVKDNSSTIEDGKELKGIRSRLLDCYRTLYFDEVANLDPKGQVSRIARNMIELTTGATLAELTSLEEMMRIMMDDKQISDEVIDKLWQIYSHSRPLPKAQRRGAILILGMLALANRHVLTDHVEPMLKIGLGNLGKSDLTLTRYTCVALQRLNGSAKKVKGSLVDNTIRFPMDNGIFRKLQETIEQPCRSKDWFGVVEQVINTVYALGEHPDIFCNEVIKKLTARVFNRESHPIIEAESAAEKDPDAMEEDHPADTSGISADTESNGDKDIGDAFELSKLLFVVGHVAIKHIVYLELVEREWKRQKDEKQAANKRAGAPGQQAKPGEDLDQVVGNAEDEIGDRIAAIRETELLYGPQSLLAIYGPMLVHICGSPHKFKSRTLRAAATLSFSKFLCVSSQFCDQNHRLLFRILETSKNPNIRSNIVIALGDVAVSFSSIIDENSDELYKGLSDKDLVVKKNTLMVLTHLILNGMVKVKGQLGEMAKCVEDEDERIADLAKLFFKELSTKENAIYNNLPDIISHLSIGQHAVDEETFQKILKHIFTYIEKEKQAENIIEKLCQRFRLSDDPRQWRDIAFCLSLLPYKSERSVKKLTEGLPFYRDKLHEQAVYDQFTEILAKARQNKSSTKPDNELNEFEQILQEHKQQGEADQALEKRVKGKKKAAARKKAVRRTTKKVTRGSDDEEE